MKFVAVWSTVGMVIVASAAAASAQSLADVARKEAERRKAITTSGKVYTNDALSGESSSPGVATPAPPSTLAGPSAPSAGAPPAEALKPSGPAAVPAEASKGEADWRKRIAIERDALSRAEIFAEALQSRINVLSADFVNRDDPAQRDVVAVERQKALSELDRIKREIQQHQKAIATIQDEARRAGVPAGWVR